jgi:predicted branched-subunit amino acid permease
VAPEESESFRRGVRLGLPFAAAGFVLSGSFGVLAVDAGMSPLQAVAMSAIVFAGSAQFAAVSIMASGGTLIAAIASAGLMNSRFLAMGAAIGPSLPGGPLSRALQGQPVVDSSWVQGNVGEGRFDRHLIFGSSAAQYMTWVGGTAIGAFGGGAVDAHALGLDAIFPTFFLALLLPELRDRRRAGVALAGAAVALALVPIAPPGAPVLAASLVALWGLRR